MNPCSQTPQEIKIMELRKLFPEAFSEGKIDFEKLKATLGEDINFANERYVLNWAGKSDAFKVLQTPSTKTLVPAKDESINFDTTENIFIEGENLEVLKVLQKSYFGKVKMIYIDPPYNTGNDSFIYPDKFSETKDEYEKRVGDKDEEGYMTKDGMFKKNSKENGQYHSNWLNMMMPRLYLAKNLLTQDGVIFVSIDDNEVHNLRLLMNEIFGEENMIGCFIWHKKTQPSFLSREIANVTEYIISFKKNNTILPLKGGFTDSDRDGELINIGNPIVERTLPKSNVVIENGKYNGILTKGNYGKGVLIIELLEDVFVINGIPQNDLKIKGRLSRGQETIFKDVEKGAEIYIKSTNSLRPTINLKKIEPNIKPPISLLSKKLNKEIPTNTDASSEIKSLFEGVNIMDYPKPSKLIKYLIESITYNDKNSIILDFFAGSGTTAHAVMELNKEDGGNRKFICVQLPELCNDKSEAYIAGYRTIADISKERIRRASKKIQSEIEAQNEKLKNQIEFETPKENNLDLGFKVLKLADSNFKEWQQLEGKDTKALIEQMQLFIDPVSENATIENMVYEFLLKSGKDLNSKIEKRNDYFVINDTEMILLLESVSQTIIEAVISEKPMKVIALDKLFTGNDQLKTNTVLQMRDAGIEFKTI